MGKETIRIGHLSTVYHTAFILMGTEILPSQGIHTEWQLYPSGPDIVNALKHGDIDLAYVGLPPVIIGIDHDVQIVCVAGGHIEGTVLIGGPNIRPISYFSDIRRFLDQFSGQNIGTPPKGSIHDIIVRDLLFRNKREDIQVKNYAWADFLHDALDDGEIIAAAGTPALAVAAHRYGNANVIMPPDQLWPFNPSYGIVSTRSLLSEERILIGFLNAHEEASEMIRKSPEKSAQIVSEQTDFVDKAYVMEAYRISPHYCSSLPEEYINSTMAFAQTLYEHGSTRKRVTEDEIFERRFIRNIHPGRYHYRDGISGCG